jgi:hypothetical protein
MTDEGSRIPSPEEFEAGGTSRAKRGVLRPLVHLVQRLRMRPGVGAQKEVALPPKTLEQPSLQAPKSEAASGAKPPLHRREPRLPRRIVFRDGVRPSSSSGETPDD